MIKLDDIFSGNRVTIEPDDLTTPLRNVFSRTMRWFTVTEPTLTDPAQEVLSEVIATLHISKDWYTGRGEEDGTAVMYAVDVINRLRKVYGLAEV